MKVSVIMPVYNREKYLASAIDSVINQSYSNFEVVIVDDGSADDSPEIIKDYSERFPDKVCAIFQKNAGPSAARNNGIRAAEGDLIAFLDSDDLYAPEKLERQVGYFLNNQNLAFLYSGYDVIDDNNVVIETRSPRDDLQGNIYEKLWVTDNTIWAGTLMVEKSRLMNIGLFDESLDGSENVDLRLKLAKTGRVLFVPDSLAKYRMHEGNLINDVEKMNDALLKIIENHLGKNGEKSKRLWRQVMKKFSFREGMEYFSNYNYSVAMKHFFKALRYQPFHISSYVQIVRCLLGKRVNQMISRL